MTTKQERAALQDQDLHKLLSSRFPEFRTKQRVFDVPAFAEAIKMSAEGVYKWLRADKISPEGVKKVVELAKDRKKPIKAEHLMPFVLR